MRRISLTLAAIAALLVPLLSNPDLSVRGQGASAQEAGATSSALFLPLVLRNAVEVPPIIRDTTEVLTSSSTQYLETISPDGTTFSFSQGTSELEDVEPGDVIVGGASSQAPNGFLRVVQSKTVVGEEVVLQTLPGTLEDALEQGEVETSRTLTPADVQGRALAHGVAESPQSHLGSPSAFELTLDDVVLYDLDGDPSTTDDQVVASGALTLEPSFDFGLILRHGELEELDFVVHNNETADLDIAAGWGADVVDAEVQVAHYLFAPITIWIGVVPIVVLPEMNVYVSLEGTVHGSITASVTQNAQLSSGLKYASDNWQPVWTLTNDFSYGPPMLDLTFMFRAAAEGRLTLSLYGVAGPYAELVPYLELDADSGSIPWWSFYGGLEVNVGIDMGLLSDVVEDVDQTVIDYRLLLAQAPTTCSGTVLLLTPPNGGVLTPANPSVTWQCGGTVSPDASWLEIQVATDPSFSNVVAETWCQPSCITWEVDIVNSWALPAGTYYWRGALMCGPGWPPPGSGTHVLGQWSDVRSFVVQRP
jgi:hypothetical protein